MELRLKNVIPIITIGVILTYSLISTTTSLTPEIRTENLIIPLEGLNLIITPEYIITETATVTISGGVDDQTHSIFILNPSWIPKTIPSGVGLVKLTGEVGALDPWQPGYLTGNWLLFHYGDGLYLSGRGYILLRIEIESWQRAGSIIPWIMEGDIIYIGEASMCPDGVNQWHEVIEGSIWKFYYLDGECFIQNVEGIGLYNLALSPVWAHHITEYCDTFNPNSWSTYNGNINSVRVMNTNIQ